MKSFSLLTCLLMAPAHCYSIVFLANHIYQQERLRKVEAFRLVALFGGKGITIIVIQARVMKEHEERAEAEIFMQALYNVSSREDRGVFGPEES